jgi:spermidine synthase
VGLQNLFQRLNVALPLRWRTAPKSAVPARQHGAALGLMLASGFAGLGYQIVWTQQCALWLGHESAALLAVVAAFFGGLGLGALTVGRRAELSPQPARWYAACEVLIALWSLALAMLLAPVSEWMLALTGAQPSALWQWCVAFLGTFIVLLPATAAMGATLPAMARVVNGVFATEQSSGKLFAALYASNTFGAVIGVLVTAFWLLPAWGLMRTAGLCAALNVGCAALALTLPSSPASEGAGGGDGVEGVEGAGAHGLLLPSPPQARRELKPRGPLLMLALTGFLGVAYEVLVVRVLSQVAEDTAYTFALLLAVYLVGSAVGAAAYQRGSANSSAGVGRDPDAQRAKLFAWQAATCLLGTWSLWGAEHIRAGLSHALSASNVPPLMSALTAEAALAIVAFGPPTVVMGMLFSHLCERAKLTGRSYGAALGCNTLGAAAAPICFGLLLVPTAGPKAALLCVVGSYVAVGLVGTSFVGTKKWLPLALIVVTALTAVFAAPLAFVSIPEGGRVVSYRDGGMAAVSVVEDADGVSRLRINNRQQEGSSASLLSDARQALLPLLLHPGPQRALFLGLGTGATVMSAAADPSLQVDAVELLPEVIEASAHFRPAFAEALWGAASNGSTNPRANLNVVAADARRFVKTTAQFYDVIVSDNFHPARSGSGSLYTVEHFSAVRGRLAAQGVFCQWLPLHQLDLLTLRSIVQAFMVAFPEGVAMLATNSLDTPVLGLVGRAGQSSNEGRFDAAQIRARLKDVKTPWPAARFGIADEFALLGSFMAGPLALKRFAGDAPVNSDDHPVVAYRAPRITYAPDSLPRDRLLAFLGQVGIAPSELLNLASSADLQRRLAAYWTARNRYIALGQSVIPAADLQRMLSQVREPLLAVLRISPDFRPAREPLLRMASALARSDAASADALLAEIPPLPPPFP